MSRTKKEKTIDWLIKNYLTFFESFGMNKQNIIDYYEAWRKKGSHGIEDYLWHIFNFLLNENAIQSNDSEGFYRRNHDIYMQMLYFRRKIEGKPANEIQQALNNNKLELQTSTKKFEYNVLVVTTDDCNSCQHLKDKTFTIEEARKDKIIPYFDCKREKGCACVYVFKNKLDKNGNPIRK